MQNKFRATRQNAVILVMNIVIVVLGIIMVITLCVAGSTLLDRYSIPYNDRSMYYCINDGDFYRMVGMYHENVQQGFEDERSMQEYYGVAKYYEAASLYKAFLDAGDSERAAREKAKMEAALVEMGSWSVVEGEIKEQLGIE